MTDKYLCHCCKLRMALANCDNRQVRERRSCQSNLNFLSQIIHKYRVFKKNREVTLMCIGHQSLKQFFSVDYDIRHQFFFAKEHIFQKVLVFRKCEIINFWCNFAAKCLKRLLSSFTFDYTQLNVLGILFQKILSF